MEVPHLEVCEFGTMVCGSHAWGFSDVLEILGILWSLRILDAGNCRPGGRRRKFGGGIFLVRSKLRFKKWGGWGVGNLEVPQWGSLKSHLEVFEFGRLALWILGPGVFTQSRDSANLRILDPKDSAVSPLFLKF